MQKITLSFFLSLSTLYSWGMLNSLSKIFHQALPSHSKEETHSVRKKINDLNFNFMKKHNIHRLEENWICSPLLYAQSLTSYVLGTKEGEYSEYLEEVFGLNESNQRFAAHGLKHVADADLTKDIKTHFSVWLTPPHNYHDTYHFFTNFYTQASVERTPDPYNSESQNTDTDSNPIQWAAKKCPHFTKLSPNHLPQGPFYSFGLQHISIPWIYGAKLDKEIIFNNQKKQISVSSLRIPTPIYIKKTDESVIWTIPLFDGEKQKNKEPTILIGIMPNHESSIYSILNQFNIEYIDTLFSTLQEEQVKEVDLILPNFSFEHLFKYTKEDETFNLNALSENLNNQNGKALHQMKIEMVSKSPLSNSFPFSENREEVICNRPFIWLIYAPELEFILAYGTCYDPSINTCHELNQ